MGTNELSSRAIIGIFYEEFERVLNEGRWETQIAFSVQSDQPEEEYKWLGATPMMREWIGPRAEKGLRAYGQKIRNKLWESTLGLGVDDLRRDKTQQIRVRIGEHADQAVTHIGKLLSQAIMDGETTPCYDGQFFFDTDHQEGDSGVLSNDLAAGDYTVLNVTDLNNVTPDEMAKIILTMIQHQFTYKNDQGEPINGEARNFLFMVPVKYWGVAFQAITSQNLNVASGTGVRDNPITGLRNAGFTITPVANPRLTWTDKVALFRTDGRAKPFIYQEEYPVRADVIGEGSEYAKLNRRVLFLLEAMYNVGFGMWQHATLATLS